MCPWREPDEDLRRFFPSASHSSTETRILSHKRLELQQRLGRAPLGEENSLYVHRVIAGGQPIGSIVTRRVRGEHGLIEIVLAVDNSAKVCGLRVQRTREPEEITRALQDPAWLGALNGKGADAAWALGKDVPAVPGNARPSAEAILEGVRSLLILLAVADEAHGQHAHH
jgi:hypothetical protein